MSPGCSERWPRNSNLDKQAAHIQNTNPNTPALWYMQTNKCQHQIIVTKTHFINKNDPTQMIFQEIKTLLNHNSLPPKSQLQIVKLACDRVWSFNLMLINELKIKQSNCCTCLFTSLFCLSHFYIFIYFILLHTKTGHIPQYSLNTIQDSLHSVMKKTTVWMSFFSLLNKISPCGQILGASAA